MKQTEIENRFEKIEKRLFLLESLEGVKKVKTDSPNESYLGTRSNVEEEYKSGQMSACADNQPPSDIKDSREPIEEEINMGLPDKPISRMETLEPSISKMFKKRGRPRKQ